MNILLVTDVIHLGGAELFVLRLGEELDRKGHNVQLFILRSDRIDNTVKEIVAPNLSVIAPKIPLFSFWNKVDGLLYRIKIPFSIVRCFHIKHIKRVVRKESIHVIHSHLFTSDLIAISASKQTGVPLVSTMHGDYLLYSRSSAARKVARLLNFNFLLRKVMMHISAIAYIADEQIIQIESLKKQHNSSLVLKKIYNGYKLPAQSTGVSRQKLKIDTNEFVIGMVARGIPDKGWKELIEGFKKAGIPDSVLLLIGEGDFLIQLKNDYAGDPSIRFLGAVHYPTDYIKLMDVACLPSYFASESLPTVVIEYLTCGKPVIASNKGEIPFMLRIDSDEPAGILIDINDKQKMAIAICEAITSLKNDAILLQKYAGNARKAAGVFDMQECALNYEAIYQYATSRS